MGSTATRLAIAAVFGLVAFAVNSMLSHTASDEAAAAPRLTGAPTTTAPPPPPPPPAPPTTTPVVARASRSAADHDRAWRALAACESSGDPRAVSPSGRYFGAFQFDLTTWRELGYSGNPRDHSFSVQLEAAKKLHARRGWQPWPVCSRRLALR